MPGTFSKSQGHFLKVRDILKISGTFLGIFPKCRMHVPCQTSMGPPKDPNKLPEAPPGAPKRSQEHRGGPARSRKHLQAPTSAPGAHPRPPHVTCLFPHFGMSLGVV